MQQKWQLADDVPDDVSYVIIKAEADDMDEKSTIWTFWGVYILWNRW